MQNVFVLSDCEPTNKILVMPSVKVEIVRFVDSAFPGWVACVLHDAVGRDWEFIEKVPIVTEAVLDMNSEYPQAGLIRCELIERHTDEGGNELCLIDTEQACGVSATTDETQFMVFAHQLVEDKF